MRTAVEQRVMKIRAVATAAQSAIANHFKVQLLKLPKKVHPSLERGLRLSRVSFW